MEDLAARALKYGPALLNGTLVTLSYFVVGSVGSLLLALPLALGLRTRRRPIRYLLLAYVEFFRNTPLLVQLFWLHYALPMITGIATTAPETAALALVLVMTAYMAEVYRAGIGSVSQGQLEAAQSLGLSGRHSWALLVLPQAFRIALPAIGTLLVALLKATTVLSILSVPELMRVTTRISNYTARPAEFYTMTAVVYVLLGIIVSRCIHSLERYLTPGPCK